MSFVIYFLCINSFNYFIVFINDKQSAIIECQERIKSRAGTGIECHTDGDLFG